MDLRSTSNHENAPDTVSFVFNHLRRAFNGAAELPLGAELCVVAGSAGDLACALVKTALPRA
jgi:hypothetical protein